MDQSIAFELPHGFIDAEGTVHQRGRMRMATALDEVLALQDARVQRNEAFLPIVLLSRVVVSLGRLTAVTPAIIGNLLAVDILYLQDLYLRLNSLAPLLVNSICPACKSQIQVQVAPLAITGDEHGS
jgi:hypothetical protein